jgi:hypothetical protein
LIEEGQWPYKKSSQGQCCPVMERQMAQALKTGTRIQMLNGEMEMAAIARWTAASGPIKNQVAPNNDGWHIVRFTDGSRLCVHEGNFRIIDNRAGV